MALCFTFTFRSTPGTGAEQGCLTFLSGARGRFENFLPKGGAHISTAVISVLPISGCSIPCEGGPRCDLSGGDASLQGIRKEPVLGSVGLSQHFHLRSFHWQSIPEPQVDSAATERCCGREAQGPAPLAYTLPVQIPLGAPSQASPALSIP